MKLFTYVITSCLLGMIAGLSVIGGFSPVGETYAQQQGAVNSPDKVKCDGGIRKCYGSSTKPMNILDDLIENDDTPIVETQLDKVDRWDTAQFTDPELKFSGTLDSVRGNISIYLQWMVFIGLVFAVILIIYNGLLLMLSPLSPDQAGKVKTRMAALAGGVILVTGFFFILKILIAVYVDVFVD